MYLWANLDETLQSDIGAPSDEHGGSDGEPSIWASGVGIKFSKRLYFVFYVIIKIIIMAAFFSSRYQHYTNYCPISTPAYTNYVAMMRVLVDHHCLRAREALVDSDPFSLVLRFSSTQWAFCIL